MPPPNENAKNAQTLALTRLGYLQVGILDADIQAGQMMRKALGSFGITNTLLSRNSNEMVDMLREKPVDILITESSSRPVKGVELTRFLRSTESPNRLLPVILTTWQLTEPEYNDAVNSGVTEIITKPYNMRDVLTAITTIIDAPRPFILAPGYIGPDRRKNGSPPPGVEERRSVEKPTLITKADINEVFIDGLPRMLPPDLQLKQKLEAAASRMAGIDNILTPVEASKRSEDYVQWMIQDVQSIQQSFRLLVSSPENARSSVERICRDCANIRTRALRTGYIFAARTATGLSDFCTKYFDELNPNHVMVMGKHVDTLQAILNAKLVGDENAIGRELMKELQLLVRRYTLT